MCYQLHHRVKQPHIKEHKNTSILVTCALMTYALICHGDRLVPARFGCVGGLSQPRRDAADPKYFRPRAMQRNQKGKYTKITNPNQHYLKKIFPPPKNPPQKTRKSSISGSQ
jgi:hypothetical protein